MTLAIWALHFIPFLGNWRRLNVALQEVVEIGSDFEGEGCEINTSSDVAAADKPSAIIETR